MPAPVERALARRRQVAALPELALRIGRALRAGQPLPGALADADDGTHPRLAQAVGHIAMGRSSSSALQSWHDGSESDAEELLVAALVLGSTGGGETSRALDVVGEGIRDDVQLDGRRRAVLTQSRLSAALLVALPLVFALTASLATGEFVYRGMGGAVILAVGLTLDGLGVLWIRRLLRRLR